MCIERHDLVVLGIGHQPTVGTLVNATVMHIPDRRVFNSET